MLEADRIRLRHILDAAREALSFAEGKSRENLDKDRMLVLSIVREVEIIGEAASRISEETRTQYPQIPWIQMIHMRNHLVHVYFDIDLDIVWNTVRNDLPFLIGELEKIVP